MNEKIVLKVKKEKFITEDNKELIFPNTQLLINGAWVNIGIKDKSKDLFNYIIGFDNLEFNKEYIFPVQK